MKSGWKRAVALIASAAMVISTLSGCSGMKKEGDSLVEEVSENLKDVSSFSNTVSLDLEMTEVTNTTKIQFEMMMAHTSEPYACHVQGTTMISLPHADTNSAEEIYQVMEDGKLVTYKGIDGEFTKSVAEEDASSETDNSSGVDLFQTIASEGDSFRKDKNTVEYDGEECYLIYGEVPGEAIMSMLGEDLIKGYGLLELPDSVDLAKTQLPITIAVYKDEMLPARILIDLSELINDYLKEDGSAQEITVFNIKLQFSDYNQVQEITVPEEIKSRV